MERLTGSCITVGAYQCSYMLLFQQTPADAQKTTVAPSSDEYVLDQLCICEEKLLKLMEELETSGKDVEQLMTEMEAEEVSNASL